MPGVRAERVMAKTDANGSDGDQPKRMHMISRKKLRDFCRVHPDAEEALDHWYHAVRKAQWRNFSDLRATYGSADQVGSSWFSTLAATSTA